MLKNIDTTIGNMYANAVIEIFCMKWRLNAFESKEHFCHDKRSMMLICEQISAKYGDRKTIWIAHTTIVNIGVNVLIKIRVRFSSLWTSGSVENLYKYVLIDVVMAKTTNTPVGM